MMMNMTEAEAMVELDRIAATQASDPEAAHGAADDVLLKVVSADVRAAYERVVAACSWWACA